MNDVLHLCSDFPNQQIYTQLVHHLRDEGLTQFVFSAVRTAAEASRQPPDDPPKIHYSVQNVLRRYHRVLFRTKIKLVERKVLATVVPRDFRLIHAHFLYSDGALALRLHRRFDIPFVCAIRNTDINAFMRLRPDLRCIATDVLRSASALVCLTPTYRETVLKKIGPRLAESIRDKFVVIPSGVAPSWLHQSPDSPRAPDGVTRVLYVGNFTRNKNVESIVRAVGELRRTRRAELTIVGGGGDGAVVLSQLLHDPRYAFVVRHEPIHDTEHLRNIYRAHDVFAMPSFLETFGLVYIEAMSQGVPVIHSRGQGIDGLFSASGIAEAVDPRDIYGMAEGIARAADRRQSVASECIRAASRFSWTRIARCYNELYQSIWSHTAPPRLANWT
jgi:glycosyltransferase involved in cell wall biosynthesis